MEQKTRKVKGFFRWVFKTRKTYSGELVASITNEHTGLPNSSISNCDTFNELWSTHPLKPTALYSSSWAKELYVLESIKVKGNTRSFKEKKLHKRRRVKREGEWRQQCHDMLKFETWDDIKEPLPVSRKELKFFKKINK